MKKEYSVKEINNIDDLPDDAVIILDDRKYKYDKTNDKLVRPDEPGYDELPDLII